MLEALPIISGLDYVDGQNSITLNLSLGVIFESDRKPFLYPLRFLVRLTSPASCTLLPTHPRLGEDCRSKFVRSLFDFPHSCALAVTRRSFARCSPFLIRHRLALCSCVGIFKLFRMHLAELSAPSSTGGDLNSILPASFDGTTSMFYVHHAIGAVLGTVASTTFDKPEVWMLLASFSCTRLHPCLIIHVRHIA